MKHFLPPSQHVQCLFAFRSEIIWNDCCFRSRFVIGGMLPFQTSLWLVSYSIAHLSAAHILKPHSYFCLHPKAENKQKCYHLLKPHLLISRRINMYLETICTYQHDCEPCFLLKLYVIHEQVIRKLRNHMC